MWKYSLVTAFLFSTSLHAEGEPSTPPDQGLWQTFVMIAIALAFFYFIMWRPEQKRRKALEEQRSTMKKGDRVVAMGIIGTVVRINDDTVILRMYDGAKLEFFKAAVTEVLQESADKKPEIIDDKE